MKLFANILVLCLLSLVLIGTAIALNPLSGNDWDLDPDNDGLTNLDEFVAESDPNNADTDGDGLPDGWEVENWLNPNDPSDADADFDYFGGEEYAQFRIPDVSNPYTNYAEFYRYAGVDRETGQPVYYPTDPNNADTDGDSVLDPDDAYPWDFSNDGTSGSGNGGADSGGAGSGPAVGGDGDGDGNADDDGDGLTDMEEMALGTDFNNPDTDGDGLIDSAEISKGLDPNDWDTDNDMLIDGVEDGEGDSTDGHITDTDNDGIRKV